ncbi:hypothetical protein [Caldisalinibacter kiritimatiensis]|uniref:Lipoprotein n=1 Tax=Caldisalinibacter kiritimatiensis TaxID=1304284 RepID=R1AYL4_9FIRM|nr:hypothetical protein [Caldisalinibacter kiritimatiensis]EOD01792.1 hypothetical protein L21TH_0128 [Caldisalinibacter kiritimatiensis]
MKLKLVLFLIGISILITGCTKHSDIEHELVFKGFVALENGGRRFPSTETLVFENMEQWNHFTNNYLNSLPYILGRLNIYVDFSNEIIACKVVMPTNERCNSSFKFKKVTLNDNILNIEFIDGDNRVHIVDSNHKTIYPFIFLVKIKRTPKLSNLKNVYKEVAQ